MSTEKQPSARRLHFLADLNEVGEVLRHPLLDLGGSRTVALSPTHLEAARSGWTVVANIDVEAQPDVIADAHSLPFADASFETVLCAETLEHLRAPAATVAEMHRVLRPGGRVVVTVPFAFRVHGDPNDFQRYTANGLRELFAAFDSVERVQSQGGPWSVIACVLRDLLYGAKPRWMPLAIRNFLLHRLPWLSARDENPRVRRSDLLRGWTTGYMLVARR